MQTLSEVDTMGWREWQELEREHPSIVVEGFTLAQPCVRCRGSGCVVPAQRGSDGYERCDLCDGTGYIATEDGKALARFVAVFGLAGKVTL